MSSRTKTQQIFDNLDGLLQKFLFLLNKSSYQTTTLKYCIYDDKHFGCSSYEE